MITHFKLCTIDGLFFEPLITGNPGDDIFSNVEGENRRRYFNGQGTGISWLDGDKKIVILDNDSQIFGLPDPEWQKVVVVYPREHSKFAAPENAVIHNADGTVHLRLRKPKLISKAAKEHQRNINETLPSGLWYDNVSRIADNKNDISMVLRIGFAREWFEQRSVNVETGELGECLSSGRF
jgi:hypothetical protein